MTHRVHPYIFRIGKTTQWKSRWFDAKRFVPNLREDTLLREWLEKKLRNAHIEHIEIERSPTSMHVIVKTSRPGIVIGRGGSGAEDLKRSIQKELARIRKRFKMIAKPHDIRLTIEEVRAPETHAAIAAQMIVDDIEKRIPFRRILKQSVEKISASRDVKGVKVSLKGRLDGAEMARYEWLRKGRIPLQTLRAHVDYAERTAHTTYGTIGVKVWIYKGDIFDKDKKENAV